MNKLDTTPKQEQQVTVSQKNISEQVLAKINSLQSSGDLTLPKNYSVENHIKSAWLDLQEVKDRSGNAALSVCTKSSIANALLDMVLQGLSVGKKQGYFLVYGNKLEFQRSYFGTVALAQRSGNMVGFPVANVIYEDDKFEYCINPDMGTIQILKHEQSLENIDNNKIVGAYAIISLKDGKKLVSVMNMAQIKSAWNQGATKGNSPAHKNFTDEMAKKTVINRACKMLINASDDNWLYDGKEDNMEVDTAVKQREATINESKSVLEEVQDVDIINVESNAEAKGEPEVVEFDRDPMEETGAPAPSFMFES